MEAYCINKSEEAECTKIECSGDLTIRHAKNILSEFLLIDKINRKLEIKLHKVEFIDLTFLQILIGLIKKHLSNKNNTLSIQSDLDEEHKNLLDNTGITDILKIYENKYNESEENNSGS